MMLQAVAEPRRVQPLREWANMPRRAHSMHEVAGYHSHERGREAGRALLDGVLKGRPPPSA